MERGLSATAPLSFNANGEVGTSWNAQVRISSTVGHIQNRVGGGTAAMGGGRRVSVLCEPFGDLQEWLSEGVNHA